MFFSVGILFILVVRFFTRFLLFGSSCFGSGAFLEEDLPRRVNWRGGVYISLYLVVILVVAVVVLLGDVGI